MYIHVCAFGGLGVACWPLVPKFKPSRSRRIFKDEKILSTPSFGREVKPSVPCRRFAACKRSLNGVEVVISDNILAHSSTFRRWDLSCHGGSEGTWWWTLERLKARESHGKLPLRMQRTRAIPVAWLNSGLCPGRPKGWIPIIYIYIYIYTHIYMCVCVCVVRRLCE
jgi:hypothetical protein